jgi:hypothetical protein
VLTITKLQEDNGADLAQSSLLAQEWVLRGDGMKARKIAEGKKSRKEESALTRAVRVIRE